MMLVITSKTRTIPKIYGFRVEWRNKDNTPTL